MDDIGRELLLRKIEEIVFEQPNDCCCEHCVRRKTCVPDWSCPDCGYVGQPASLECECYDYSCGGKLGGGAAMGCPHGAFTCPICDGGNRDVHDALTRIRSALLTAEGARRMKGR